MRTRAGIWARILNYMELPIGTQRMKPFKRATRCMVRFWYILIQLYSIKHSCSDSKIINPCSFVWLKCQNRYHVKSDVFLQFICCLLLSSQGNGTKGWSQFKRFTRGKADTNHPNRAPVHLRAEAHIYTNILIWVIWCLHETKLELLEKTHLYFEKREMPSLFYPEFETRTNLLWV